jgi:TolA-binding protein
MMKGISLILILGIILGIGNEHLKQADLHYEQGEYSQSLREIKEALKADPEIKNSDIFQKRYSSNEDIQKLLGEKEGTLATLKGVVRDSEGNPVEEAFISAGGIRSISDQEGKYQIAGIALGETTLHAWAKGSRYFKKDIHLEEGENNFPVLFRSIPIKKKKREWQTLKTMNFIIKHKNKPLARRTARRLEAHLDKISKDIGLAHHNWKEGKAKVILFKSREDYLDSGASRASGGYCKWTVWRGVFGLQIDIEIATTEESEEYLKKVFPHELTHALYAEYTGFFPQLPDWINEGIAEYEENKGGFWSQEAMEKIIDSGNYLTIEKLSQNLKRTPGNKRHLYYLESQSIVRFIIDKYGWDNFKKLSKKFRRVGYASTSYKKLSEKEYQDFLKQAIRSTFCPKSKKDEVLTDFNKEWVEYIKEKAEEERKARDLLENGQYEEIINQYAKCSYAPLALEKLAESRRFNSKDYSESIKCYRDLIAKYPETELAGNALFAMANIYENNLADFDKAVELYKEFIKKYPESDLIPRAHFRLGFVTSVRLQEHEEGASLLKEYVHTFPHGDLVDYAQFLFARSYQARGEPKRALGEYAELLNKYSKGTWVDNARKEIFSILAEEEALSSAEELYQEKDYQGALQELQDFQEKYPLSNYADDALLKMGFIHTYNLPDFEKAKEIFRKILHSYPDWETAPSSLYYLGVIEDLEGNKESARSIYRELLKKYPQSIWSDNIKVRLKTG